MRISTLMLLCSMMSFWAQAQFHDSIFYNIIETNISNEGSSLYYPVLLEQFQDSASYMTSEERVHFYYGSRFQEFYNPTTKHILVDSIMGLMNFTSGEVIPYDHINNLCDSVLNDQVIHLNIMLTKLYVLSMLGDTEAYEIEKEKYDLLILTILESEEVIDNKINYLVLNTSDINHVIRKKAWKFLGLTKIRDRDQDIRILLDGEEKWVHFNIGPVLDYINTDTVGFETPD